MPREIVRTLLQNFGLTENAVYRIDGPVNLNRIIQLYDLIAQPDLKYPPMTPRTLRDSDGIFETVTRRPAAAPSVRCLHRGAGPDPAGGDRSERAGDQADPVPHRQGFADRRCTDPAARNGKDVTVVVELRARFDEEANLGLADRLQEAGVQVVYGVVGYKTHAKMLLIVRREGRKLRRYVHLGTGNYHSGTARAYTDISLITADPDIGNDVHLLFQQLSGLASKMKLKRLLQSPFTLHTGILGRIERETRIAAAGRPARIIAKMNALNEPQVVRALYAASQAGVQIDLIIRGACTLRPGVPGISDNIRVRSIVGRFRNTAASTGSATTALRKCTAPAPTGWSATCCAGSRPASRSSTRSWPSGSIAKCCRTTGRQSQRTGTGCRRHLPQARAGARRSAAFRADGIDAGAVVLPGGSRPLVGIRSVPTNGRHPPTAGSDPLPSCCTPPSKM